MTTKETLLAEFKKLQFACDSVRDHERLFLAGARAGLLLGAEKAISMTEFRKSTEPLYMSGEFWACSDIAEAIRTLAQEISEEGTL